MMSLSHNRGLQAGYQGLDANLILRGTKYEHSRICSNNAGSGSATEHFVVLQR